MGYGYFLFIEYSVVMIIQSYSWLRICFSWDMMLHCWVTGTWCCKGPQSLFKGLAVILYL